MTINLVVVYDQKPGCCLWSLTLLLNINLATIDIQGVTSKRVPYIDYYFIIRRAINFEWQREWENSSSKLHYIKPSIEEWESAHYSFRQHEVKLSRIRIGHIRIAHGFLMTRNEQQPTCLNVACRNQTLTNKHCLVECSQWRDTRKIIISRTTWECYWKVLWSWKSNEVFNDPSSAL